METTCAICGGGLDTEFMEIRVGGVREHRPVGTTCPKGCTDTPDYTDAQQAVQRGESWSPSEPSHCNVSMLHSDPGVIVNGRRQARFTCQICNHSEQRDEAGAHGG